MRPGRGLFVCLLILLGACASSEPSRVRGTGTGPHAGLMSEIWVVRDPDERIARALAPFDDGWESAGAVGRWRRSGLRLVRVPLEQLRALRSSLTTGGQVSVRPLGEVPAWTEFFEGQDLSEGGVRLDSGFVPLDPGRPRLLVRAWSEPRIDGGEVVGQIRVEMVPQHHLGSRDSRQIQFVPIQETPVVDEGLVFERLLLSLPVRTGEAYLVVGEAPEVDWHRLIEEPAEPEAETPAGKSDSTTSDGEVSGDVRFPRSPGSMRPTLGEALLNAASYTVGSRDERAVIVLIPPAPAPYSLLGG